MALFAKILSLALLFGCNSQTNLLGRTVPDEHKENFYHLLDMGRSLYDQGKLAEARRYAIKAFAMDPDSEDASILLGYVDLSLAGGDPFGLAKALIAAEKEKKAKQFDSSEPTPVTPAGGGADDSSTGDTLSSVSSAIGITDEELQALGTFDFVDPDFPVVVPNCVEDVRATVARLTYVNEAIRAICPFVDPDILNPSDYRQICDATKKTRTSRAKAHFLWAFTHLTEAISFNAVLTYKNAEGSDGKTNLEKRVEKIQSADTSDAAGLANLLEALKSVESTVNSIFPATGVCSDSAPTSQLRATLNDMSAVDQAFSRIAGVPDGIVNSVKKSMAKINGAGGGSGSKLAAMKGDFTKKIGGGLSAKIEALAADPNNPLPPEQKEQMCTILSSISSGANSSSACE